MCDERAVWEYVERCFQRSGQTEFPTVRQVARRFKIKQSTVEALVGDCPDMFLTYWNVAWPPPLGDYFVETVNAEPDR